MSGWSCRRLGERQKRERMPHARAGGQVGNRGRRPLGDTPLVAVAGAPAVPSPPPLPGALLVLTGSSRGPEGAPSERGDGLGRKVEPEREFGSQKITRKQK